MVLMGFADGGGGYCDGGSSEAEAETERMLVSAMREE